MFQYSLGDGNDTIVGFSAKSTLSIGDGTESYSTVKSGKNIIVTAGDDKITLEGAASLSAVNINGTKLLTVTNETKSPVTVDATTKIIDASKRTTAGELLPPLEAGASWINEVAPKVTPYFLSHKRYFP